MDGEDGLVPLQSGIILGKEFVEFTGSEFPEYGGRIGKHLAGLAEVLDTQHKGCIGRDRSDEAMVLDELAGPCCRSTSRTVRFV